MANKISLGPKKPLMHQLGIASGGSSSNTSGTCIVRTTWQASGQKSMLEGSDLSRIRRSDCNRTDTHRPKQRRNRRIKFCDATGYLVYVDLVREGRKIEQPASLGPKTPRLKNDQF
jgi:hypothetical protein